MSLVWNDYWMDTRNICAHLHKTKEVTVTEDKYLNMDTNNDESVTTSTHCHTFMCWHRPVPNFHVHSPKQDMDSYTRAGRVKIGILSSRIQL